MSPTNQTHIMAMGVFTLLCVYPRRDGQADLTWVPGYIQGWFTRLPTPTFSIQVLTAAGASGNVLM